MCISHDILQVIGYKQVETEEEMLNRVKEYLNTKVHPTVIRQLEVWKSKQQPGSSLAESMRRQVQNFYHMGMDRNTPED